MNPINLFCHILPWVVVDNYIVYDSDDGLILATIEDNVWEAIAKALVCQAMLAELHLTIKPITLTPEDVVRLVVDDTSSTIQTPEGRAQSSSGLADVAIKTETLPTEDNFMGACVKRQSPKVIELQGNLEKPQNGGSVRRRRQLRW